MKKKSKNTSLCLNSVSKVLLQLQELLLIGFHYQTPSPHWLLHHPSEVSCLLNVHIPLPRSWHRRMSPISAGQSHQLAADRNFHPPLAATSWSAPPPRTSAPVHSKGMEPAAGALTGIRDIWPLQDGIKGSSSLYPVTVPNCLPCRALVMTIHVTAR